MEMVRAVREEVRGEHQVTVPMEPPLVQAAEVEDSLELADMEAQALQGRSGMAQHAHQPNSPTVARGAGGGGPLENPGSHVGGAAGLYGGAAGASTANTAGLNGAQGIIVITYTPAATVGRIIRLVGHVRIVGGTRLSGSSPVPR